MSSPTFFSRRDMSSPTFFSRRDMSSPTFFSRRDMSSPTFFSRRAKSPPTFFLRRDISPFVAESLSDFIKQNRILELHFKLVKHSSKLFHTPTRSSPNRIFPCLPSPSKPMPPSVPHRSVTYEARPRLPPRHPAEPADRSGRFRQYPLSRRPGWSAPLSPTPEPPEKRFQAPRYG